MLTFRLVSKILLLSIITLTFRTVPVAAEEVTPEESAAFSAAIQQGQALAANAIEEHDRFTGGRTFTGAHGVLVAEGDSWFDYPLFDTLNTLQWQYDYEIASVAHKGDTLESMAYDEDQFMGIVSTLKRLKDKQKKPKAILLSGGGNDIAGPELAVMLNHVRSGSYPLNDQIVQAVIANRLQRAMLTLISAISQVCNTYFRDPYIPVLIHGYDYPIPDGRGYVGGFWVLPGPWLKPAFDVKGYSRADNDLTVEKSVMHRLIDEYNKMLRTIPLKPTMNHVHYVSIVGTLNSEAQYKTDWGNELHPTRTGFGAVAKKFHEVLQTLP